MKKLIIQCVLLSLLTMSCYAECRCDKRENKNEHSRSHNALTHSEGAGPIKPLGL